MDDTYRPAPHHTKLGPLFYDEVKAANFPKCVLRYRNDRVARDVGLADVSDQEWIRHFGRFEALPDNIPVPLALRYHGHQFRRYNPDLGDGRGFLFAQLRDSPGRLLDLATKGSGRTPWSRAGDGRLTLKGGVREILATEMLEALGVYTSKTFSLIETGESLTRGDEPSPTRSSVLVRLGHSHIRLGTFQRLLVTREYAALEELVDYSIQYYWPEAAHASKPALVFYEKVVTACAQMGAEWFVAGFVHGVLNTDNINITGESFDYGPWRFLPAFDPGFTAAYFDEQGLYAFGRQVEALHWNLARFAECLLPLVDQEKLEAVLGKFEGLHRQAVRRKILARLGLHPDQPDLPENFVQMLTSAMRATNTPYEQVFYDLLGGGMPERLAASPIHKAYAHESWQDVLEQLRRCAVLEKTAQALQSDYACQGHPETMLIDEVEALWSHIADHDDWQPFEDKLAAIRKMGDMYRPLLQEAGVLR